MSENSTLEEFTYPLSLSSRSSTPGETYHPAPLHYVAHSTAWMLSQSSDDWVTSSPASVVGPPAFAPNPFRYNHQKAPSVHLDCRQCITLKQEKLVLETENATLRNAYDALLQVVGPAMFLAQTASPSDGVDLTLAGFSGLPSTPAIPALSQADYPAVNFWHAHEYRAHVDQSKGESNTDGPKPHGSCRAAQEINVTMCYVKDADGVVVNGFRATEIRGLATKLFALLANGAAPASWNKGSLELQSKFSAEICRKFPEMGFCANDWKVQHMATRMYSSWYRTHTNSQVKLEAAEDDPVVLPASKPTKRPQPISTTANKRVRLSETPPPLEYFAVVTGPTTAPTPKPVEHNSGDGSAPIPSKSTEEPTEPAVAFKIINPLLATPSAAATTAAAASLPITDIEIANPPLSVTQATPASAVTSTMEVVPVVTPLPTTVPATGTVLAGPSEPLRPAASKFKPKELKANPGTSTTPRNLCMIDWCKKHPSGYLSQFKAYWDSIENTSDAEPHKQASANAATSKTKAAS
ncbi:hypothetical protein B0H14DRAFT_2627432 [Mycena olivaceomarginata]|nr:hypothetical protein B0H14DRAFT_2627432 [Mycena olivaceomarginata]